MYRYVQGTIEDYSIGLQYVTFEVAEERREELWIYPNAMNL
jgi:hypothetical protein